jgi:hypothetical protein
MKTWPKWFRIRYYADGMREVGHTCSVSSIRDVVETFDFLQLRPEKIIRFEIDDYPLPKQEIHELFMWIEQNRPKEEGEVLKNGKKPTKKQKEAIKKARLNPDNWLVVKNLTTELHIVHRTSGKQKVIPA